MSKIHIGEEWVNVPTGYIGLELKYCYVEHQLWQYVRDQEDGSFNKETIRKMVLNKRMEFYNKNKGKINVNITKDSD